MEWAERKASFHGPVSFCKFNKYDDSYCPVIYWDEVFQGNSLVVQWLELCALTTKGVNSVCGQETYDPANRTVCQTK